MANPQETGAIESVGIKGLSAIPVAGPALAAVASSLISIFGAAHSAAVAKEASTINAALPTFVADVKAVMVAANEGAISESQALNYLGQAQSNYETTVSGIIKDNGECIEGCYLTNGSNYMGTHCCNSGSSCNAACCLRCGIVVPTVENLSAIINNGSGSWTIPGSSNNGSIQGTAPLAIAYSKPNPINFIEGAITGKVSITALVADVKGQSTGWKIAELGLAAFILVCLFRSTK